MASTIASPTVHSLRPDDLAELGLWLRQHDFAVSSTQLITAARLLNGSRRAENSAMLAAWLAPVFCHDLNQQTRFKWVYEQWQQQRLPPVAASAPADSLVKALSPNAGADSVDAPAPLPEKPDKVPPSAWARLRGKLGLEGKKWLFLALLLVVNALLWSNKHDQQGDLTAAKKEAASVPSAGASAPLPSVQASANKQPQAPEKSLSYQINQVAAALLLILLLGTGGWWWYARARQRAFFQSLPTDTAQERRRLRSVSTHSPLSKGAHPLAANLRRRFLQPTQRLDVPASIAATLRAGGMPSPVFGSLVQPAYVVLVDCAGRGDHLAQLTRLVLGSLQNHDLMQNCYEFDSDPRRSRHAPLRGRVLHHGLQSLPALASRHAGARLLIFSDGRGFFDPYTEAAAAWLSTFAAWEKPVLLTPQARQHWGAREWRLIQAGLVLLPMDGEGMQWLGQLFDGERGVLGMSEAQRKRLRPLYLRNVDLWLDQIAPPPAQIVQLLQALQADLHSDGMAWLCACAVYPELYWRITLMLGEHLVIDRERHAACLARLVRLPWLRAGFMPGWLREALLAELAQLSPHLEAQVRQWLAGFLAGVFDDPQASANDALHVAMAPGQRRPAVAQARKDAVFLRFMGGKPTRLMVAAGERLRQLLYKQGVPMAGPRRLPLVLAGVFAGVLAASVLWMPVEILVEKPPVLVQEQVSASSTVLANCDFCPEMVQIPAGQFEMGSNDGYSDDEKPVHTVKVPAFMMSKYEVTQAQWKAVMGSNPSAFEACEDNCPVDSVSWDDAQAYIAELNAKTGRQYRLPSEAEWEYAARAGSTGKWSFGDDENELGKYAWYGAYEKDGNSAKKAHPVGEKLKNQFGLYDMHGNVWEWVEDCFHDNYKGAPQDGSAWTTDCKEDAVRVLRGGGWFNLAQLVRSAYRNHRQPGGQYGSAGFRLALRFPSPAGQ